MPKPKTTHAGHSANQILVTCIPIIVPKLAQPRARSELGRTKAVNLRESCKIEDGEGGVSSGLTVCEDGITTVESRHLSHSTQGQLPPRVIP